MVAMLKILQSLLLSKDDSADETIGSMADSEAESDGEFHECESLEEPNEALLENQENALEEQSVTSSAFPPLSSIRTAVVLSFETKEGDFVDLDSSDDFDRNSHLMKLEDLQNASNPSADDFDRDSSPLKLADLQKVSISSANDFDRNNSYLKLADLQTVSNPSANDFDRDNSYLKLANLQKVSNPSAYDFDRNSSYLKVADLQKVSNPSANDFDRNSSYLKVANLQNVSNSSKGDTVYKNELQTLCQRGRSQLPVYSCAKEGPAHKPFFKAIVEVKGQSFESESYHKSKSAAEQDAARVALFMLSAGQTLEDQSDVKRRLTPAVGQINTQPSDGYSRTGARSDPVTKVKLTGQLLTSDGLTADSPIDLTMEVESVGSNPPLATASSSISTRSQAAFSSYEQFWGPFDTLGTPIRGVSTSALQTVKSISSDRGSTTARLGNEFRDTAGQFSELQSAKPVPASDCVKQAEEPQSVKWPEQTEHLKAFGKLEFSTHGFPLLTKLHGLSLEKAFSVEEIMDLLNKPADKVYPHLLDLDKRHNRPTSIHRPTLTHPELLLYQCYVKPDSKMRFEVVENRQGSTLLQRTLGFDKVLQVVCEGKFPDSRFKSILKNGIFVGPRLYQYFVHKPADDISDEEKRNTEGTVKCYFVCTDSQGERDLNSGFRRFNTIADARSLFMHADRDVANISTVSKFIARNQLCLSKTITITDISFSDLVIQELEDLPSKDPRNPGALFTDGTGFISTDLARIMPTSIFQGMKAEDDQENEPTEDYPSLIQMRFFHNGAAYKGTLLANKKLAPKTVSFYKSMKKVQSYPLMNGSSVSSFELVTTSRRPRCAKLSRDLIVLLSIGGVQESIFLDALKYATHQVLMILEDRKQAHKEILKWEWKCDLVDTTLLMIAAGIPLNEPNLRANLLTLTKNKLNDFGIGKFSLNGSFYLMGTADPTGTLKPNEVVILRSDKEITGKVIIFRHPGKHPGDPHQAVAVQSQAIEDVVGGAKNIIVFSTQGTRPLVHEIANGDFDGDSYWICNNKKVVDQFSNWPSRWNPGAVNSIPGKGRQSPKDLSPAQLEDALLDEYLDERFKKSSVVSIASCRWLNHIDSYLDPEVQDKETHMRELLKYPDYIYEGVDFKSGVKLILPPEHESIKRYKAEYLSNKLPKKLQGGKSILGQIHDVALLSSQGMNDPSKHYEDYHVDPAFCIKGSEKYRDCWDKHFSQYGWKMREALEKKSKGTFDPEEPNQIYESYRKMLYGAASFKERTKDRQQILEEASAIYQVVYYKAGNTIVSGEARVAFAWRVAGAALTTIYAEKQPGESIVWSQAAYDEVHRRPKTRVSAPR